MMVLKMRFENPEVDYVKDFEPRQCWKCDRNWVCEHKTKLDECFRELPTYGIDSGIARAWLSSWAVFCPYFKLEEMKDEDV